MAARNMAVSVHTARNTQDHFLREDPIFTGHTVESSLQLVFSQGNDGDAGHCYFTDGTIPVFHF